MSLITTLTDTIDDSSLNILGAARIEFKQVEEPTAQTQGLTLLGSVAFTAKVVGGHFTDSTLTKDLGNEISFGTLQSTLYVSNNDCIVFVQSKYTTRRILMVAASGGNKVIDLDTLEYMNSLEQLDTTNATLKGSFHNFVLSGGINNITILAIPNGGADVDLADFAAKEPWSTTSPIRITLDSNNVHGNIGVFNGIGIDRLSIKSPTGLGVGGDLSRLNAKFFTANGNPQKFNWAPGVRPSSYYLTAYEGVDFGNDLDAMFNDIQNCDFVPSSSASYHNTINVRGNRTSASDAAVAAIKAKGLVVKVNGITL